MKALGLQYFAELMFFLLLNQLKYHHHHHHHHHYCPLKKLRTAAINNVSHK